MRVFFDGLCEPENPGGVACYGFVVYEELSVGEVRIFEHCGVAAEPGPDSTHNVAEYTGLIKSIEWVLANQSDRGLEILGDSHRDIQPVRHSPASKRTSDTVAGSTASRPDLCSDAHAHRAASRYEELNARPSTASKPPTAQTSKDPLTRRSGENSVRSHLLRLQEFYAD